jgi:hypothetical protein
VYEGEALVALVAVRRPRPDGEPRLNGVRVATLSDVLVDPARRDAVYAAIRAAEQTARTFDADALLCSASHAGLRDALKRRSYVRVPGTLQIIAKTHAEGPALSSDLSNWWLLRADSHADESF